MAYDRIAFVLQKIQRMRKTMEKHEAQREKERVSMLHEMKMLSAAMDDLQEQLDTEKEKSE